MPIDSLEEELTDSDDDGDDDGDYDDANDHEESDNLDSDHHIHVETSNVWAAWRDNLAREMFENWQGNRYT